MKNQGRNPGLSWTRHESRTILGQSLVEVVVALGVAVLVIIALARLTVTSIRNADFARKQGLATKYAQEWIEEARKLRDEQPDNFFTDPSLCNRADTVDIFNRTRICTLDGETMTVVVEAEWTDSSGTHQSRLETRLTKWR